MKGGSILQKQEFCEPVGEKKQLRRELLTRRAVLPEREEKNRAIFERVSSLGSYCRAGRVLFYISSPQEADTRRLLRAALGEGKEVFAPVSLPEGELAFYRLLDESELRHGRFGILEPPALPERMLQLRKEENPSDTLCLVPGLAFDRLGYRLGYGKGYYDRFLAKAPVFSLGLCYQELVLPRLPVGKYDRRVTCLVTEWGELLEGAENASVLRKEDGDRSERES